jgi:hypothetical protein
MYVGLIGTTLNRNGDLHQTTKHSENLKLDFLSILTKQEIIPSKDQHSYECTLFYVKPHTTHHIEFFFSQL